MTAQLQLQGEITVISLGGRLNIEKAAFLRAECMRQLQNKKVVFCLNSLHFVGSSGIQTLFQLVQDLKNHAGCDIKMAGLNPDFQRLWQFGQKEMLEIYDNLEKAVQSFQKPSSEII